MSVFVIYRTGVASRRMSSSIRSQSRHGSHDAESHNSEIIEPVQSHTTPQGQAWLDGRFCDSPESIAANASSDGSHPPGPAIAAGNYLPEQQFCPPPVRPFDVLPLPAVPLSPLFTDGTHLISFGEGRSAIDYDTLESLRNAQNVALAPPTNTRDLIPAKIKYNLGSKYGTIYYDSRVSLNRRSPSALRLPEPYQPPLRTFVETYGRIEGSVYYDSRTSLLRTVAEGTSPPCSPVNLDDTPPSPMRLLLEPIVERRRLMVHELPTRPFCSFGIYPSAKISRPMPRQTR